MIVPKWKVSDTLSRNYSEAWPAGTRVVYDRIKADPDYAGGIAVRCVEPFRRPTWLSAVWLSSYRREPKRTSP